MLTVQDSPRVLQRAQGAPLVATLHLTLDIDQRIEPPKHRSHHRTFSFRQDTHAVIFLLISGGLRSPKDSRSAAAAEGRDIMGQTARCASSSLKTTKQYAVWYFVSQCSEAQQGRPSFFGLRAVSSHPKHSAGNSGLTTDGKYSTRSHASTIRYR